MTQGQDTTFVTKVLLRQPIRSFRLVIALFTVSAAITKILYDLFLPHLHDYHVMRWAIIGLGVLLFTFTMIKFKRSIIVPAFSLVLYLTTLFYVIAFVIINRFDPYAVILLILVYGASSVVINNLFYYGVQCTITLVACGMAYLNAGAGNENLIGFLVLLIAMGVFGIVMTVRLKLITDIKNSYSHLEKLNIITMVANQSGEIVFVSPTVKSLLGYAPHELLKKGWWTSPLREGWISREYILNYPGGVPDEIASVERHLVTKSGKKIWLHWTTSMLPNGNYLGVGFEITKYKPA
jgi:PAS domain S-box-containing protein